MRDRNLRQWIQGWAVALALGALGVSPALSQTIVNPVPNQLLNGQATDASTVMANFNSIINNVNANAAHNGSNSDITALTALSTLATSGSASIGGNLAVTGTGAVTGALSTTSILNSGNLTVGGNQGTTGTTTLTGALTANGGITTTSVAASGALSAGAITGSSTIAAVGQLSGSGVVTTGNNALGGITYHGGATSDAFYSTLNGSLLTAFGAGVRASNTVSARFSLASGTFNATFNTASATRTGTGVWNIVFTQALNSNAYQVNGNCVPSAAGTAAVCPAATAKTTAGFTLNFLGATTGAVADLGATYTSDIIVAGGN